jgi:hypothetical protein
VRLFVKVIPLRAGTGEPAGEPLGSYPEPPLCRLVLIAAVSTRSLLALAALTALVVLVVVGAVVSPAIWSRKKHRPDAALAVLERIFGWRSPALPPPLTRPESKHGRPAFH